VIAASDATIAGESLTQEYSTNGALRRPIVWRFNILALESARCTQKKFGTTPVWRELFCSKSGRT
jgi:hypothetical protein